LSPSGYAITGSGDSDRVKQRYLHRQIAEAKGLEIDGSQVDHINLNKLDNRRENLRPATHSQNMANKPPRKGKTYKGTDLVSSGRFRATGQIDGKKVHIGTFDTEAEAARAYDAWATITHGEFAYLNFEVAA